jgi:hypothetical protein
MADKTCFVIAPIGEPASEIRKRSDQVFTYVITPAVQECGYTALRADQISEPGLIDSQVIERIVNDPLVIADLTGHNPNVFYELALKYASVQDPNGSPSSQMRPTTTHQIRLTQGYRLR